nr:SAC3 GANP Nin1 mts3 eIF-3 p25 domain containing protein [Haemonchus contortus]
MFPDGKDMLASIPMPGSAPPPPPSNEANTAWEKAQQALKKIGTQISTSTANGQPPPPAPSQSLNAHALMMQYYPWMAQQYANRQPPTAPKTVAQAPSAAGPPAPGGLGVMPDNVRRYVERAYLAAQCAEDRQKVQEYLEKRLRPLLQAGTTRAIDWDREPLPHERGYELPTSWTPAGTTRAIDWDREPLPHERGYELPTSWTPVATLRASMQAQAISGHKATAHQSKRERKRTASPDASADSKRDRRSSSSSSDVEVVKVKSIVSKKKTQKERKREGNSAKKEKRKLQNAEKQKKEATRWHVEEDSSRIEERAKRFANDARSAAFSAMAAARPVRMKLVKGTCQNIEKSFFRLTAAPDPSQVRPPEILEKSLDNVKEKYRAKAPYRYLSDQLRSIRQDLTVQRVRNYFTVQVYEINARIALENKDREEFNKCQSQLKLLYNEIPGCSNEAEFIAYRLLYYIAMDNSLDVSSLLKGLADSIRADECVMFAMRVRRAVSLGNYPTLFRLFKSAPKMCPYLMDLFVERERKAALMQIFKAFRPSIPVSKVSEWLGMSESSLVEWLNLLEIECQVGGAIDCRAYATKTF